MRQALGLPTFSRPASCKTQRSPHAEPDFRPQSTELQPPLPFGQLRDGDAAAKSSSSGSACLSIHSLWGTEWDWWRPSLGSGVDHRSPSNVAKGLSTREGWKLKPCSAAGSEASLPRQGTPGLLLRGRSSEGRQSLRTFRGCSTLPGTRVSRWTRCWDHDDYAIVEQYLHFSN